MGNPSLYVYVCVYVRIIMHLLNVHASFYSTLAFTLALYLIQQHLCV